MGAADDAVRRQLQNSQDAVVDKLKQIAAEWVERMEIALPISLENLTRLGFPPVAGYKEGELIQWGGDERYAWCLWHEEDHDRVFMLADGTFLRSPLSTTSFEEVTLEEAARLGGCRALERMAEFQGGPPRVPTFWEIFFPKKKRKWLVP